MQTIGDTIFVKDAAEYHELTPAEVERAGIIMDGSGHIYKGQYQRHWPWGFLFRLFGLDTSDGIPEPPKPPEGGES